MGLSGSVIEAKRNLEQCVIDSPELVGLSFLPRTVPFAASRASPLSSDCLFVGGMSWPAVDQPDLTDMFWAVLNSYSPMR